MRKNWIPDENVKLMLPKKVTEHDLRWKKSPFTWSPVYMERSWHLDIMQKRKCRLHYPSPSVISSFFWACLVCKIFIHEKFGDDSCLRISLYDELCRRSHSSFVQSASLNSTSRARLSRGHSPLNKMVQGGHGTGKTGNLGNLIKHRDGGF